ncbi:flagellar protein [Alcanivorax sp. N3-2A]|nr:flagellar protein [Alcanivorax sp. N3-2A]|tara:strand:+ start:5762 stop:6151 length:390 start_codon:yes stop_codon:yes gene_type:complete
MTDSTLTVDCTPAQHVLGTYEQLLACSTRMLGLVRRQDWEALIGEETDYLSVVSGLAELEQNIVLSKPQQDRKADLLERILEQDMEIRQGLMARRDELSRLMDVSRRRRDLGRSYGRVEASERHDKGRS